MLGQVEGSWHSKWVTMDHGGSVVSTGFEHLTVWRLTQSSDVIRALGVVVAADNPLILMTKGSASDRVLYCGFLQIWTFVVI